MKKLAISEFKELGKDVIEAWKLEGRDLSEAAQVIFYPVTHLIDSEKKKPSDEEIKNTIQSLVDIPRIAPLIIIFVSSPIPGGSILYLSLTRWIEKITGNRIRISPRRFNKIIDRISLRKD